MKRTFRIIAVALVLPMLAACGNTKGQRALSGGAIGAGVGAVGGAIVGANPVAGAVVGGAAGAVTGAATSKKQINFGNIR